MRGEDCDRLIAITIAEYESVRADPRQFAVARDHVMADLEQVVAETDRYTVVAKREGAPPAGHAIHQVQPPSRLRPRGRANRSRDHGGTHALPAVAHVHLELGSRPVDGDPDQVIRGQPSVLDTVGYQLRDGQPGIIGEWERQIKLPEGEAGLGGGLPRRRNAHVQASEGVRPCLPVVADHGDQLPCRFAGMTGFPLWPLPNQQAG